MATVIVPLNDVAGVFHRLGPQLETAIGRGLVSAAARAKTIMDAATINAPPASANGSAGAANTGEYRRRWKGAVERRGNSRGVLVSNDAPYAGVIEYGRRPGARRPPVEPIARWLQRKLTIPYPEARSRAFAIARAIGRRGLRPRLVLTGERTQTKLVQMLQEEVMHEIATSIRELR